jgi:hypothetical protein
MYDEYVQLLSHTASNIQIKAKGKRQAYLHDVIEDTFNEDAFDTCDETHSEPFDPLKLYKPTHQTTTLNLIGAIITIEFECLEID